MKEKYLKETPIWLALNMSKVVNNQESFNLMDKKHDDGVMAHLIRGPYIIFFQPTMEEAGWRSYL